jgi:CheY-like chemotaxis protein
VRAVLRADHGEVEIRVEDTGAGIAPEFLPFVFERFRQADGSTTREFGGLGLGLSIVHDLVHLHHGTVSASSPGRGLGSEFVVRLPQLVQGPAASSEAQLREEEVEPRLSGVNVLVVDDNDDALEVAAATLSAAGAIVRIAHTGEDAIAQWQAEPGDVLVCDLAMPAMDGFEVLRRIRAMDAAAGTRTFTIALTAYASQEYVQRTRDAGFNAHIAKPFDPVVLLTQIAAAVS